MEYLLHILVMVALYVILATSFNLLIGFAGLFALSHAAFYAFGAYITAILTTKLGLPFPLPLIAGIVFTAGVGALVALPALRISGDYLVIVTLALQIIVLAVIVNSPELTGGTDGIRGVPNLSLFGYSLNSPGRFLIFAAAVAAVCFAVARHLANSPFGRALKAMRENESAAQAVGKNLLTMKVTVFAFAAGLASVAGALFAHYFNYVGPDSFTIEETIYVLAMVILGGTGNLWGAALGAAILVILPELLKFVQMPIDIADKMRLVIYGAMLILILRFRPEGLLPEHYRPLRAPVQRDLAGAAPTAGGEAGEVTVTAKGLRKAFGGIVAVRDFDIDLKAGQIAGLIGPNGAGKTTAFNLLTGFLQPDAGSITLRGRSITGRKAHQIVASGVARSFQDLRLFTRMTVLDNVLVALPDQAGDNVLSVFLRPFKVRQEEKRNLGQAFAVLEFVNLQDKAYELADNLSYAEEKLLVIARLLATGAEVLLFDEPMSGLDANTLAQIFPIIRKLAATGKTICIIEHNLDVVKELCDVVYFLDEGRTMAVGTPHQVMTDPELATRYFR